MTKIKKFKFYPAHTSNFTKGRGGRTIKYFTVHHTAGFESTLRHLWNNPDRNASSHFFAGDNHSEQYVDTDDTAWTNGVYRANQESITVETRGDWRNGYYDGTTLKQLAEIMYESLKLCPKLILKYHMDFKSTLCPADLKHKKYALQQWDIAKNRIKVENTASKPSTPVNLRIDIPDKKVILIRDTNLWDMSFKSFATARAIKALPKGTVIDVAGVYDHPLSKSDYYLSNYSWNSGQNNGINQVDCKDYVPPKPEPQPTPDPIDVVKPKPEVPDEGSGTLPPLPVDPDGNEITEILKIVRWIRDLLSKIFNIGKE